MKVVIKVLHDSHNTDTTASIGVRVDHHTKPKVTFTFSDERELTVSLEELVYALNQPR